MSDLKIISVIINDRITTYVAVFAFIFKHLNIKICRQKWKEDWKEQQMWKMDWSD